MNLKGRACIVTGAGKGIGRATTLRLVGSGADVLAVGRTARNLEETLTQTATQPGRCVAHVADVTRSDQVTGLVKRCVDEFGAVHALINNAGTAPLSAFDKMDEKVFHDLIAVNINAVFYACKAAWPALKSSSGTIINISSVASTDPFPGFAAYGASKAWVNIFTRALADEGKSFGIKVFAVAPGAVETQMLRGPFPDFPADKTLQPDDIAAMIELLLDERCQYSTGQTIFVKR